MKRMQGIGRILLIILTWGGVAFPAEDEEVITLPDLLSPPELSLYRQKPSYRPRMELFRRVLDRYSRQVSSEIKQKKIREATQTLREIRSVVAHGIEETRNASSKKDFRSKQVKQLEIRLRKLVETLDDLKIGVPFEYRIHFEETVNRIEALRDRLLQQLFGDSITPDANVPGAPTSPATIPFKALDIEAAGFVPLVNTPTAVETLQRRYGSSITGDQFTDAEYEKIQDAQELVKRVEVFLEVSESRLQEISRRMENREWDKKEPNPLEFYTYGQLIRAYHRALRSLMINIEEKASYKLASEKDIRKSLKKLNEKILEFIPQLEPIHQLAVDLQDEELYLEMREAQKMSDKARKGSQYALGAPVKN